MPLRKPPPLTTEENKHTQAPQPATTQRPRRNLLRWGLWCFVLIAVCCTGALLYLQHLLAEARTTLAQEARQRFGASMSLGPMRIMGLQGVRVDGFQLILDGDNSPKGSISIPQVNIFIDLIDLLYGELNIEKLELNQALIELHKPPAQQGNSAFSFEQFLRSSPGESAKPGKPPVLPSFRVIGQQCRFKLYGFLGEKPFEFSNLNFDIMKMNDAEELFARINSNLNASPETVLNISVRYANSDDFDARLSLSKWDAGDFLRMGNPTGFFLESGIASPAMRISGFPNSTVMVAMDIPFSNLKLAGQPDTIEPVTGSLTGLAQFDVKEKLLTLNAARLKSNQVSGAVEGTIALASSPPELHMSVSTDKLPVQDLMRMALQFVPDYASRLTFDIQEPYEARMLIDGPVTQPEISVNARVASGTIKVNKDVQNPAGAEIGFGPLDLKWKSGQQYPTGSIYVTQGFVNIPFENLRADNLNALITLDGNTLKFTSAKCTLLDNIIQGHANYQLDSRTGDFFIDTQIARLEDTPLGNRIKDLKLANAMQLECSGTLAPDEYTADLQINATQTMIAFEWWFKKPPGIGATIHQLKAKYVPGKPITIVGSADLATTKLKANIELQPTGTGYALHKLRVDTEEIDAVTAGKCLNIPYTLTGGKAKSGFYERVPVEGDPNAHIGKIGGYVSSLSGLPDGLEIPIHLKNAEVEVILDSSDKILHKNVLTVSAEYAEVPSLEHHWLLPLNSDKPDPDTIPVPNEWTFLLSANNITLPPWQGAAFKGTAYDVPGEAGLREFTVQVQDGTLNGSYRSQKEDNVYFLDVDWEDVPANFIMEHLALPQACNGLSAGVIHYAMDSDDAGTLAGNGHFTIRNGQFSADYLIELLGALLEEDLVALPTTMKFSEFSAQVEMKGDEIIANDILIETDGMRITGEGSYVLEGDMDYNLRVTLAPDTAMRIPILRDSFNLRGHKFTQNELTLGFHITGPMFNPSGSVNELPPVGVTFFSGAAETTAEALSVIDIPRKILLDLFKIGGGIAASTQRDNNTKL